MNYKLFFIFLILNTALLSMKKTNKFTSTLNSRVTLARYHSSQSHSNKPRLFSKNTVFYGLFFYTGFVFGRYKIYNSVRYQHDSANPTK